MRSRWSIKSADNVGCRSKAGSQEKDCLQPSEAPGDSQAGSLRAPLLHMATGEALSLPSSPSERTELQGIVRSSEGLWSTLNRIPLPLVSYPDHSLSDNTWLGSPSNLSWISSAKDSEMKLRWVHNIPNGTLVWVPLCLPGWGWRKTCNWSMHSSFKPFLSKDWGSTWGSSDAEMNRSVSALEKWQNL